MFADALASTLLRGHKYVLFISEFCLLATGAKSEFLFGKFEEES